MIDFMGRCSKYVDQNRNRDEIGTREYYGRSDEVHKNAVSRYDRTRLAEMGKGNNFDNVTRKEILRIEADNVDNRDVADAYTYDGYKSYHCMGKVLYTNL